jgi:hypothetical protein
MFRPLLAAARAAVAERRPIVAGFAALTTALALQRSPRGPRAADGNVEDIDRLIRWIQQRAECRMIGWPADRLRRRLIELYLRADENARSHVRRWVASALEHPERPVFDDAIALAAELRVPEARPALLAILADFAVPADRESPPALDDTLAAHVIAAIEGLAQLGDPRDQQVFSYLVARFCRTPMDDERHWQVARRAAVALVRSAPQAAARSLPVFFRSDPALAPFWPSAVHR